MRISIIIPVYNGEKTLPILIASIKENLISQEYEIILIHDCGKDNSWEVIKSLKNENPNLIQAIKLSRNFGQHNAIICGIKYAKGEYIVTMDEDLQHNPKYIVELIKEQKEKNCDVVYGKYYVRNHNLFRNITSKMLNKLMKIGIPELHPDYSSFRLIKNNIAKKVLEMNNSYTFLDGYISWITTNISSILVQHEKRYEGKSSYTLRKLINHSINIFVTFSDIPIRLVTLSSFVVFFISALYSIYLILRKFLYNDLISGYTSNMVILGFGIGLILFSIGTVGEYIHRINLKSTKRPNYFESEIL
jgi:undecaprenyl-phosphate 4-deoxy-4-formamido-L-arabinose transferase